jgi:hypothetical protein
MPESPKADMLPIGQAIHTKMKKAVPNFLTLNFQNHARKQAQGTIIATGQTAQELLRSYHLSFKLFALASLTTRNDAPVST